MTHWILQKNFTNARTLATIKATLEEDRVSYEEVFSIPFSDELPVLQQTDGQLIFYGSTTLILNAYLSPEYQSGVFYDPDAFAMSNYLRQWGTRMLNHDSRVLPLGALAAEDHSPETPFFIRPDADSKAFTGRVMRFADIRQLAESMKESQGGHLEFETPIVASRPKVIEKEWRSFVVGGKVVSTTRYLYRGELDIAPDDLPAGLNAYLEEAINWYQPHPVFVMDTALSEGKYWILECNCFNGTGFYGHDIPKVIRAVDAWRRLHTPE
jgi:hypothetical protein